LPTTNNHFSFNASKANFRNDWYIDWLCTPPRSADGQPRVLTLNPTQIGYQDDHTFGYMLSFLEHIKKVYNLSIKLKWENVFSPEL
jgi:hypothetical protein